MLLPLVFCRPSATALSNEHGVSATLAFTAAWVMFLKLGGGYFRLRREMEMTSLCWVTGVVTPEKAWGASFCKEKGCFGRDDAVA
jgi:hypothetical protein